MARRSLSLLGVVVLLPALAWAQSVEPPPVVESAPAPQVAPSVEHDARAEVAFIKNVARLEKPRADLWRWAWFAGYAVSTVGQLVPVPFLEDAGLRIDFLVGAASCLVGAVLMLAVPLKISVAPEPFETLADDGSQVERARALVHEYAEDEAFGVSWLMHAGNVALNAVVGALLGFVWHRWESAAINFASGVLVGEVMIFTQPTGFIRAKSALEQGRWAVLPCPTRDGGLMMAFATTF